MQNLGRLETNKGDCMLKAALKPRWTEWERQCLQVAVSKKIQHKVVSLSLRRSVSSINKQLKTLGLCKVKQNVNPRNTRKTLLNSKRQTSRDLKEMNKILKSFAPLHFYQKGSLDLKKEYWQKDPISSLKKTEKGRSLYSIKKKDAEYVISPLDHYIMNRPEPFHQTRIEKIAGYPFYVPYQHVEQWALLAGYRPVQNGLSQTGLRFWKDGHYFSKAQLLMIVNKIRTERNLRPILYDKEEG
jgi:hypothetical protein